MPTPAPAAVPAAKTADTSAAVGPANACTTMEPANASATMEPTAAFTAAESANASTIPTIPTILESVGPPRQPFGKLNKRTPVTIIIGLVCGDSIVVASDSQVSQSVRSTSKRMDGEKIREVRFKNACGLVANSGSMTYGQRVAELIIEACATQELTHHRQLADAAEGAVREVTQLMLEPYRLGKVTSEELQRCQEQNNYSILVANYFKDGPEVKPFLFTIESTQKLAKVQKNYVAIGCGAGVAEFLISWFDFSKMQGHEAAVTAAFIIGEVKKFDCYCGGPTQVRLLYSGAAKTFPLPDEAMPMIEAEVEAASRQYKTEWGASVSKAIRGISQKL